MVGVVEALDQPRGPKTAGDWVLALSPTQVATTECLQVPLELLIPLPVNLPPQTLLQAQQHGAVIFACERLPNMIGKTAVVIGQRSAGLYLANLLKQLGANKIVGLEHKPNRTELSQYFGATH